MTLWGCRLGAGFLECASESYTLVHMIAIVLVLAAVITFLFYCGVRLLRRL